MCFSIVLLLPLIIPQGCELPHFNLLLLTFLIVLPEGYSALMIGYLLKEMGLAETKVKSVRIFSITHIGQDATAFV
jgi:hypothetical protein